MKNLIGYDKSYEEETDSWIIQVLLYPLAFCYAWGVKKTYHGITIRIFIFELSFSISGW